MVRNWKNDYKIKSIDYINKRNEYINKRIDVIKAYVQEHGKLPPLSFKTEDGEPVGQWIYGQRKKDRKGSLNPELKEKLMEISCCKEWMET